MKADLAEVRLDTMTVEELQALADERSIPGVDRANQTKDEMVATIRQALPA